jgi:putative glutamine amidotransferase
MRSLRYPFIQILALCAVLFAAPAFASPVVGISGPDGDSVRAAITQIRSAGATPLYLGNFGQRNPDEDLKKIDALMVMGNAADIDPERYIGRYKQGDPRASVHPKTIPESATPEGKARADYEYAIIEKALGAGMPVLGICGGMQRLNVLLGGTMHQHVPDLVGHEGHSQPSKNIPPFIPVEPVIVKQDSMLGSIASGIDTVYTPGHTPLPPGVIMENSRHHQAVDQLGEGLRVAATAEDDITLPDGKKEKLIEAIEADPNGKFGKQFVLGVQWHPEYGASPLAPKIAQRLTQEAQKFAAANNRRHDAQDVLLENTKSAEPYIKMPEGAMPPEPGSMTEYILNRIKPAPAQP